MRVERFEPEPTIGWDRLRTEFVHELRWWSLAEIGAAVDTRFAPAALHDLIVQLRTDGIPVRPIDTGV